VVLNVAAAAAGQALMAAEVRHLRRLAARFGSDYLPRVYLRGGSDRLPMFLGQWLDGFHEFHWSRDPTDDQLKLVVWDPDRPDLVLSAAQVTDLFRQTALVLTWHFDLDGLGHIGSWHHGAGDFVVRPIAGRGVAVRLITVRRYAPLIKTRAKAMLPAALALFLVKLSLQNRMDRRDGVHEPVLAPPAVIPATVAGVYQALANQVRTGRLSPAFFRHLRQSLSLWEADQWHGLVMATAAALEKGASDPVWHLEAGAAHSAGLHAALQSVTPHQGRGRR